MLVRVVAMRRITGISRALPLAVMAGLLSGCALAGRADPEASDRQRRAANERRVSDEAARRQAAA